MILKVLYLFAVSATILHQTDSAPTSSDLFHDSNGIFSIYLYSQVSKTNQGSLLVSPLSLNYALTAASLGAAGNSLTQLRTVLNQADDKDSIISAYKTFSDNANKNGTLTLVTQMFIDKQFEVNKLFADDLTRGFKASIKSVDFVNYPDDARETINSYVKEETNKVITDLFQPGSIKRQTKSVIASAVYFKANWRNPFAKSDTKLRPFYSPNDEYQVDTMFKARESYRYVDNKDINAQIIELPYEGDYSLLVILPKDKDGIAALENKIKSKAVSHSSSPFIDVFRDASWETVDVFLPKFNILQSFQLKETLQTMGLKDIFNEKANFSNLAKPKLQLSDVIQKSYFGIDETGSLAGSGPGTVIVPTTPAPNKLVTSNGATTTFNANHPFLFVIKLGTSNSPFLTGRYMGPEV